MSLSRIQRKEINHLASVCDEACAEKVRRVIASCTMEGQLAAANRYKLLALKRWGINSAVGQAIRSGEI